jgi:multiple sugar transport system substrate-binding protein
MKKVLIFLAAIALVISFTGCSLSNSNAVKIKVTYWGDNKEIKIIESIIEPWQKKHPDIKVILEHIPSNQYADKIITEIAGGTGPDVLFCEVNNFVNFYSKNIMMPLDDLLKQDTSFNISDFYPQLIDRFTRDGKLYVIPRDIAPFACVFYNKNLFQKEGVPYPQDNWTTDDLVKLGKQLTKANDQGMITQYGYYGWCWWNWLYTFGGGLVDNFRNPTKLVLNTVKSRRALKFNHDLMFVYGISPRPGATDQSGGDLFMTGRLAMYGSGIWETPQYRTLTSFEWDVAMWPSSPEGTRGYGSGGSGYGIMSGTKHPKEAWEVIKALTGDDGQIRMALTGLAQPAKMSLARGKNWATDKGKPDNKKMLDAAVKYITFDPFDLAWPEVWNSIVSPNLDLYFRDQKSLDDSLQTIEKDMSGKNIRFGKK